MAVLQGEVRSDNPKITTPTAYANDHTRRVATGPKFTAAALVVNGERMT
jgi:hypothetical protein